MSIKQIYLLMHIIHKKTELSNLIKEYKKKGKTIGFVPTMGALHTGHLSLVDIARKNSDIVVVSIFVNPAQFAPNEDLNKYPRQEKEDIDKLEEKSVEVVYLPSVAEMYPDGFKLNIELGEASKILEGEIRPHFFSGVALVVIKLFMQILPDIAVFGEKDYQQLFIINKLVRGLNIPVKIMPGPIFRENSGLAMSSRNVYLKGDYLSKAAVLYTNMLQIKDDIIKNGNVAGSIDKGKEKLLKDGFETVDYITLIDKEDFSIINSLNNNARLLIAARISGVRLLDNIDISVNN